MTTEALGRDRIGALLRRGAGAPLLLLALLAMIVVPLPTLMLDALFSLSIAISLIVLLSVVYVARPLDLSVFPTVLLMATLLRLALNVASTRLVLLNGHQGPDAAGKVIEAFGQFVIGGNYAVGLVVFAILTIINFVVVTKGAGRISEVSARFTLDALPGKQMAIDADLNAGLLTREDAKARRQEVREEADFYGSMDGASKFVRGDAIAGILILFINIFGGLAIGTLEHGMAFADAARVYVLLTIGDGLVAQIPGLLVSTAVAILVTRVSGSQDMGDAMASQVFAQEKALAVGAALLIAIGLVPGMPNLAFLGLGAALALIAWRLRRGRSLRAAQTAEADARVESPANPVELSWEDVRPVDALGIEVGYRLVPLVDRRSGGELLARIKGIRKKLTQELGFLVPQVHIRDNLELAPSHYRILIHGVPVASGDVQVDRELALSPGGSFGGLVGIPAKDPAFGLDALWLQPDQRSQAEALGCTVVDPATVLATHAAHVIRQHAPDLLGHEEVQQLLAQLARTAPRLAEELTPKALPLPVVAKVLQNLLTDRIPIRQFRRIAESLLEQAAISHDPSVLTAAVRAALGRFIVQEINGMRPELPVYTLAPDLERVLQDSSAAGAIEPGLAERLHRGLNHCVTRQEALGEPAVLLVPGAMREMVSRLVRHSVPGLSVLAYPEVPEDKHVKLVGSVS
ncbi:MAG TPA: flagellar biosynthesis protein FlhA [Xanthomonadales bacterium]|nr:flagellar biosynthesis protein FlhA [Xanthomonadales bacterium]